jgi:hypothetical protein
MVRETVAIDTRAREATPRISILGGVVASEDLRVRFKGQATWFYLSEYS